MASDACFTAAIRVLVAKGYASDKPSSTGLKRASRPRQPSHVVRYDEEAETPHNQRHLGKSGGGGA